MSYDPNSLETQKGKLGEEIIRRFYDEHGASVYRPDGIAEGQASLVDFHVIPYNNDAIEEHLVEVKVRNAMQYAFGRYPCYTIPVAQVELYKQFASDRNLPLILWIVDPKETKMYSGELAPWGLENKVSIDGKEFPFDQQTKCGNMRFYHRKQFDEYPLDERHIREFEELEEKHAGNVVRVEEPTVSKFVEEPAQPTQSAFTPPTEPETEIVRTWTAPNGTLIEELLPQYTDEETRHPHCVQWLHLGQAIGYKKEPSLSTQETLKALNGIRLVSFPVQVTFRGCEHTVLRQCIQIEDVPAFLERYIDATYGARQGSMKYNRHMEATRLAVWWKNVVLEGN